jgi:hypothetical protein
VVAVAVPLALLPVQILADVRPPSPLVGLLGAPFRVFRLPYRFFVLAGFGTALLAAAALESLRRRLGRRIGTAAAVLAILAILWSRATLLSGNAMHDVSAQSEPMYDVVRSVAAVEGSGALLELPLHSRLGITLERDAMLGSLRHGLPLVSGMTGYPPRHRVVLEEAIDALPHPAALDRLADLTHLRWLLLRPAEQWVSPRRRSGLLNLAAVRVIAERGGWTLARVDREPRHGEWFDAIAAGESPDVPLLDVGGQPPGTRP